MVHVKIIAVVYGSRGYACSTVVVVICVDFNVATKCDLSISLTISQLSCSVKGILTNKNQEIENDMREEKLLAGTILCKQMQTQATQRQWNELR